MRQTPRFAVAAVSFVAAVAPLAAQGAPQWATVVESIDERTYAHAVYDPFSARGLVFGQQWAFRPETWTWDGRGWSLLDTTSPPTTRNHAFVFDTVRREAVLFGGWDRSGLNPETWTFDGARWTSSQPSPSPSPRWSHGMAFDAARGETVMFGGSVVGQTLGDTWCWDGAGWTQRSPGSAPSPRLGHTLAYDALRREVVLFGGWTGSAFVDETWVWDGSTWSRRTPVVSPPARSAHAMSYDADRGVVVVTGGVPVGAQLDVWEWDGSTWTNATPPGAGPSGRESHAMFYDAVRRETIVFAGSDGNESLRDTWAYDGAAWRPATTPRPRPRSRTPLVVDTQRERILMFGGGISRPPYALGDTWTFERGRWLRLEPVNAPLAQRDHVLAYDGARDEVVFLGPWSPDETWLFDGADWRRVVGPTPPWRDDPGFAWHPGSRQVVLFGGYDRSTRSVQGDTWVWDGAVWTQATPSRSPPPLDHTEVVADPVRDELVLFGGWDGTNPRDQTWVFDGTTWTQRQPATRPPATSDHELVWDPIRREVVLFDATGPSTWHWNGVDWRASTWRNVVSNGFGSLAFDPARGELVAATTVLGYNGHYKHATRVLTTTPPELRTYGTGCAGAAGQVRLTGLGRPGLGAPDFALAVTEAPARGIAVVVASAAPAAIALGPCTILHDTAAVVLAQPVATSALGLAELPISVPFDPSLAGGALYAQAGALDAGAPLGFVLSAGLEIVVGD